MPYAAGEVVVSTVPPGAELPPDQRAALTREMAYVAIGLADTLHHPGLEPSGQVVHIIEDSTWQHYSDKPHVGYVTRDDALICYSQQWNGAIIPADCLSTAGHSALRDEIASYRSTGTRRITVGFAARTASEGASSADYKVSVEDNTSLRPRRPGPLLLRFTSTDSHRTPHTITLDNDNIEIDGFDGEPDSPLTLQQAAGILREARSTLTHNQWFAVRTALHEYMEQAEQPHHHTAGASPADCTLPGAAPRPSFEVTETAQQTIKTARFRAAHPSEPGANVWVVVTGTHSKRGGRDTGHVDYAVEIAKETPEGSKPMATCELGDDKNEGPRRMTGYGPNGEPVLDYRHIIHPYQVVNLLS